jgi:hypothetical protein
MNSHIIVVDWILVIVMVDPCVELLKQFFYHTASRFSDYKTSYRETEKLTLVALFAVVVSLHHLHSPL